MVNNLKIIILFLAMSFVLSLGFAQKRSPIPNNLNYDDAPYHFGFVLGVNQMGFSIKTNTDYNFGDSLYGVEAVGAPGFVVGIVTNLRLGEYFDLRFVPVLAFGERAMRYYIKDNTGLVDDYQKNIETTNVEFPFELKWKGQRINNYRPYVLGGLKYSLDLASMAKQKQKNPDDDYMVTLERSDFSYTFGVGFDFYLAYKNKVSLEFKMSFGMVDLLHRDGNVYTDGIEKLSSRNIQLVITFE